MHIKALGCSESSAPHFFSFLNEDNIKGCSHKRVATLKSNVHVGVLNGGEINCANIHTLVYTVYGS